MRPSQGLGINLNIFAFPAGICPRVTPWLLSSGPLLVFQSVTLEGRYARHDSENAAANAFTSPSSAVQVF
jgi:hypothetical protein